jgi:hypothetical protein
VSDPGFREIHLSGKHVVFLFMAGAVAAVGIFLLGVSVGKGITKADADVQAAPSPAVTAADPASLAATDTRPKPGELNYFGALQGRARRIIDVTGGDSVADTGSFGLQPPRRRPSPTPTPDKPPPNRRHHHRHRPVVTCGQRRVVCGRRLVQFAPMRPIVSPKWKKGYDNAAIVRDCARRRRTFGGPFSDRPAADAMKARLAKDGIKSIVSR